MLSFYNVHKNINETSILQGVSGELKRGQTISLVGPSGSGKSTLLRALCMIDPPNIGSIHLCDKIFDFSSDKDIRPVWPKISMVYQQFYLWPHLTVIENVNIALKLKTNKLSIVDKVLSDLNIEHLKNRYPNEISVGQKQRVALARCLVLQPDFVLLDEVSSSLDTLEVINLVEILSNLKKSVGVLFVTHSLPLALNISNQVWVMVEGKIVEKFLPSELSNAKSGFIRTIRNSKLFKSIF